MTTTIAKTILTITPMIDKMRKSILESNKTLARKSINRDTYETAQKILDNIECCDELYNLKVLVMCWYDDLPDKSQSIIKLFYLKRQTIERIVFLLRIARSSLYKLIDELTKDFANYLEKTSIDYFNFKRLLKRNDWIRKEYQMQLAELDTSIDN